MRIRSQKLKTMEFLSEKEGKLIGPIRRLQIDSKRKAVVALVSKGKGLVSEIWVEVSKIKRVGEDVVFIEDMGVIQDDIPMGRNANDLKGLPVTSLDGKQLGELEDISIDTESWSIYSMVLNNGGEAEVTPETVLGEDAILLPKGSAETLTLNQSVHSSFLARVFGAERKKGPTHADSQLTTTEKSTANAKDGD